MTHTQFAALSRLMRLLDSPTAAGLRLVLVEGLNQTEAAKAAGTYPTHLSRAVKLARQCLEDAKAIAAVKIPEPPRGRKAHRSSKIAARAAS